MSDPWSVSNLILLTGVEVLHDGQRMEIWRGNYSETYGFLDIPWYFCPANRNASNKYYSELEEADIVHIGSNEEGEERRQGLYIKWVQPTLTLFVQFSSLNSTSILKNQIHNLKWTCWIRQGSQFGRSVWTQIVGETAEQGSSNLHFNCNGFWWRGISDLHYLMYLGTFTTFWTSTTWTISTPQQRPTLWVLLRHTGTRGQAHWLSLWSLQVIT